VIGPDEWARGVAQLRDDEVPIVNLVAAVADALFIDTEDR
jgi:hypothetical protein